MTKQRNDTHSTEFGLWLRQQLPGQHTDVTSIDSQFGYLATNVDYVWHNWKTRKWIFIEEKRFGRKPRLWQKQIFDILDRCARNDNNYNGFYELIFENTNPEDGGICLNGHMVEAKELLEFLQLK